MALRDAYTHEEWLMLQLAPLWVFHAVGCADCKLDQAEVSALMECLATLPEGHQALLEEIVSTVNADLPGTVRRHNNSKRTPAEGLHEVGELLRTRATPQDAENFRHALLWIGHRIAEASGGFLGVGKVCADEQSAIATITTLLGGERGRPAKA